MSLRECRALSGSNRNPYLLECVTSTYVELMGCTLDANGTTYDAIYCRASTVHLQTVGMYNAIQGLEVYLAHAVVHNCKGSCTWAMVTYAGYIIATGTVPNGSRVAGNNGQLFDANVTVDYGTAIPVVVPDSTTVQYATLTKSYRGGWRSDTVDVVQGVYSDYGYSSGLSWNYGCMWFGNLRSVLSGMSVKSATLTLYRKTGSGSSSAKTLYLCAITNTTASGAPSIAANYGAIGTIGRAQQATFAIPLAAVQGLANGTYPYFPHLMPKGEKLTVSGDIGGRKIGILFGAWVDQPFEIAFDNGETQSIPSLVNGRFSGELWLSVPQGVTEMTLSCAQDLYLKEIGIPEADSWLIPFDLPYGEDTSGVADLRWDSVNGWTSEKVFDGESVYYNRCEPVLKIAQEYGVGYMVNEAGLFSGCDGALKASYDEDLFRYLQDHGISWCVCELQTFAAHVQDTKDLTNTEYKTVYYRLESGARRSISYASEVLEAYHRLLQK